MPWWLTLAISTALAGALRVFLRNKGWWPDWEDLDQRDREEKVLLTAYRQWRKNRRTHSPADRTPEASVHYGAAELPDDFGTIEERSDSGALSGSAPACEQRKSGAETDPGSGGGPFARAYRIATSSETAGKP